MRRVLNSNYFWDVSFFFFGKGAGVLAMTKLSQCIQVLSKSSIIYENINIWTSIWIFKKYIIYEHNVIFVHFSEQLQIISCTLRLFHVPSILNQSIFNNSNLSQKELPLFSEGQCTLNKILLQHKIPIKQTIEKECQDF